MSSLPQVFKKERKIREWRRKEGEGEKEKREREK